MALVAFASAAVPAKEVDMTVVIDLLGRISKVDPKTIDKILKTENLTYLDKKDPKMAQLARLLERVSKVNWVEAYIYSIESQFTYDNLLSIDGKKVDMKPIFELLARIADINWAEFSSLFGNWIEYFIFESKVKLIIHFFHFKVSVKSPPPSPPGSPTNSGKVDFAKLKERIDRLSLIELDKFVASSK